MKVFKIYWRGVGFYVFGQMLACLVVMSSEASAGFVWTHTDGDGWTTSDYYDDDGNLRVSMGWDPDGNWTYTAWYDEQGNMVDFDYDPNPAEDDGSSGLNEEQIELLVEMTKDMAYSGWEQEEIWQTLIQMGVIPDGDAGSAVIDPYDFDTLYYDEFGYGVDGFNYDPNVPLGEQLPRDRSTDEEEDEEDESYPVQVDPSSYGEYYGLNPEIVNPVPALIRR